MTRTYATTLAVTLVLAITVAGAPQPAEARTYAAGVPEARAWAKAKLGAIQFGCLDRIAEYESHWNPRARNRHSGAYGVFQALPPEKMRRYGADYMTSALTQTRFGIAYTKSRYGSACGAWAHIVATGWY
jgi:hypothetical protein